MTPDYNITKDAKIGKNVKKWNFINMFDCAIGENTKIASFVEIGRNVKIGKRCKIQSFVYIPEGVEIEDDVFIGPGVVFTNDKYPGTGDNWQITKTRVKKGASIGANATIVCGVTIGKNSLVGAGSVVVNDIKPNTVVAGNPARVIKERKA